MDLSFLVVDDERLSRDYIQDLILEFLPGARVFEASSVETALPVLEKERPDILFLDISMPEADGFQLLEKAPHQDFELVFITAFNQFALKALKAGACDYLLKPLRKDDFKETLDKAITRRKNELERRKYALKREEESLDHKLIISQQMGMQALRLRDIVYLKADNTYTTLYTNTGEKTVSSKPIHHFEETLDPKWFFRIHKSHIINLYYFKEYSAATKSAVMQNGEKLIISRYRLSEFFKKVKLNSSNA